jgi:hypothetical protein
MQIPIPKTPMEWLDEIARAYIDARETIPYGRLVSRKISEKDLYHLSPTVCLKFRGYKRSEKVLKKATNAALTSYVATRSVVGDLMDIPQISFAFCYLSAHFGLDLVDETTVAEIMDYIEVESDKLVALTK